MAHENRETAVQIFGLLRGHFETFCGLTGSIPDCHLAARQRGKRHIQCCLVAERYLRIVLQNLMRLLKDIFAGRLHFRCSKIFSFRFLLCTIHKVCFILSIRKNVNESSIIQKKDKMIAKTICQTFGITVFRCP